MIKEMIVSSSALETKVAILEDDQLAELYVERNCNRGILSNTYKGKVTKVLPGMQSAFVDIGLDKDAFLYVSDFVEDNEECDQVFSAVEEQMDTATMDIEVQDRPQRREKKPEKRYRERRSRSDAPRMATSSTDLPGPKQEVSLEHWDISAETEIESESHLESGILFTQSDIPELSALVPSEQTGDSAGEGTSPETFSETEAAAENTTGPGPETVPDVPESSSESAPLDSASIRDDGERLSYAADDKTKTSFARRRGAAARRKRYTTARHTHRAEHQSIDDMLQEGQEVLVQVAKEPIAKKGARVTSHIALPGRYLVYMPTVDHVGVSRKIGSDAERSRLKDIILKHRDRFPGGVIVRTAAEEHSEEDMVNDLNFLVRLWEEMRSRAEKVSAPALIHAEMNLVQRLLRDQFSFEFAAIRVDDETEYQRIVEFVDKIFPNLVHRVKLYTKKNNIFDEYGISSEIDKLLQPKIWLKSGGYIVINQTGLCKNF